MLRRNSPALADQPRFPSRPAVASKGRTFTLTFPVPAEVVLGSTQLLVPAKRHGFPIGARTVLGKEDQPTVCGRDPQAPVPCLWARILRRAP